MKKPSYPAIELKVKPESAQILVGQTVTLSWKVRQAQKVYVLQGPPSVLGALPVDWRQLGQEGEEVKQEGQMTVSPQAMTTYTLAAIGPGGRQVRSVTVEVLTEKPRRGEPRSWFLDWDRFPLTWRQRFDERVHRWLSCFGRNTEVTFSARPRVAFTNEEVTLTWEITCSDCAEMSDAGSHIILVADPDRRSGTRDVSGVGWASDPPACSLDMRGKEDVGATMGSGHYRWTIFAEAVWGSAASATVQAGFMPHPLFDGCNADRQSAIENALKDIYGRLLDGRIRDNADLDGTVAAFQDGWLNRIVFWTRLLDELENINLVTFRCNDTTDEEWRGGNWEEYSNIIDLDWSPSHAPRLAYVILHELIHKGGFNGDLSDHYSDDEIEEQAHQVADACFPIPRFVDAGPLLPSPIPFPIPHL